MSGKQEKNDLKEAVLHNPNALNLNEEEGFFYEKKADEGLGIETKTYPNGNQIKKLTLPDGKIAIVRELEGHESSQVDQMASKDNEKNYIASMMHFAVQIDGNSLAMEDYLNMKFKIYNRLKLAVMQLNF